MCAGVKHNNYKLHIYLLKNIHFWENLYLQWTAPYSKFPGRVKNKGLKMDWSCPFQWTNLQLDRTTDWTTFSWNGPRAGPLFSGLDHTLDRFCLDQTKDWTAWYSKFPCRVTNKWLNIDWSGPFQWTNFQLDRTMNWTNFSGGSKQGLKMDPSGPF